MNSEEFIKSIKRYVQDVAKKDVIDNLEKPPGRRVSPTNRDLSGWYNGLSIEDKSRVARVIEESVHSAIFGFLVSIDGDRKIDNENGRYELSYITDERFILNPYNGIGLHDLFNAED